MRTEVYQITRTALVRVAAMHYFIRMWPIFVAMPVFGVLAMLFGQTALLRAIGFLALLWPFTIPARAAIATWSKAKILTRPTWVLLEEATLYFHSDQGGGMKLPLNQVRRLHLRGDFYVFETRRFNFAVIPRSAVPDPGAFENAIRAGILPSA